MLGDFLLIINVVWNKICKGIEFKLDIIKYRNIFFEV